MGSLFETTQILQTLDVITFVTGLTYMKYVMTIIPITIRKIAIQ